MVNKDFYRTMPKIDLHRHLEGSIRLSTLSEIASQQLPELVPDLVKRVKILADDPRTSGNFLSKFLTLRKFFISKEIIQRMVSECLEDAAADHLIYLELRFSANALSQGNPQKLEQVMSWVVESALLASQQFSLPISLLLLLNRHEALDFAARMVDCAVQFQSYGLLGLDLAGDEAQFSGFPFRQLLNKARNKGFLLTIHAGEWGGAENVAEAINILGANRIGHGVRIMEDDNVVELARKTQIPIEICLTSNIKSGIFDDIHQHPLPEMLRTGLNITINSDDPQILNINLSDELLLLNKVFDFSTEQIFKLMGNAIDSSFLDPEKKAQLHENFSQKYQSWNSQS